MAKNKVREQSSQQSKDYSVSAYKQSLSGGEQVRSAKQNQKNEIFIFRYDPSSSFEGMFEEFWVAVDGKIQKIEPHIVRSNSIEALSINMTKNRLKLFACIAEKKPNSLTELAHLLQKDYTLVRRDARILEAIGLISLERQSAKQKASKEISNDQGKSVKFKEVKPVALYKRIVFDFPIQEEAENKKGTYSVI